MAVPAEVQAAGTPEHLDYIISLVWVLCLTFLFRVRPLELLADPLSLRGIHLARERLPLSANPVLVLGRLFLSGLQRRPSSS